MTPRCPSRPAWRRYVFIAALMTPALAHAAHPLFSDDTGTQGTGAWQIEANSDRNTTRYDAQLSRTALGSVTLTYGASERLDVALTVPYQKTQTGDAEPYQNAEGIGDVTLGLKWRVHDEGCFSFALKPSLSLPTGNSENGMGNGRYGAALAGLGMVDLGRVSFLLNVAYAYNANRFGAEKHLWSLSGAMLAPISNQIRLVLDIGAYADPDPAVRVAPTFGILGFIWSPTPDLDIDVGYRHGINKADTDHTLGGGITFRWR